MMQVAAKDLLAVMHVAFGVKDVIMPAFVNFLGWDEGQVGVECVQPQEILIVFQGA